MHHLFVTTRATTGKTLNLFIGVSCWLHEVSRETKSRQEEKKSWTIFRIAWLISDSSQRNWIFRPKKLLIEGIYCSIVVHICAANHSLCKLWTIGELLNKTAAAGRYYHRTIYVYYKISILAVVDSWHFIKVVKRVSWNICHRSLHSFYIQNISIQQFMECNTFDFSLSNNLYTFLLQLNSSQLHVLVNS